MQIEMLKIAVDKVLAGEGPQQIPLVGDDVWALWLAKGQVRLRKLTEDVTLGNEATQGEGRPTGSPA